MQATFGEMLLGAALLAGCGGGAANLSAHEIANESDAAVATDQPEAGPDPCEDLEKYGDAMVATCSYYRGQCVSQRRNKAESYRLMSPLFEYFPTFPAPIANNFDECVQEGARTAQLLGPLPYANFSSLYGDPASYALEMERHRDEFFLHPVGVDAIAVAGILSSLGNKNLGTNAVELEQILHADILLAHKSRSAKKTTVFIALDIHVAGAIQDEIADLAGELNTRGVTFVGVENATFPLQIVTPISQNQIVTDQVAYKIAAGNPNIFGVEDNKLWSMQGDPYYAASSNRVRELRLNQCEIMMEFIRFNEIARWRSFAIAFNLGELMEQKHETASVLIVGASHLVDLEQIFDRLDISYVAVTVPSVRKSASRYIEQSAKKNESMFEQLKGRCGHSRIPATLPPGPPRTPSQTTPVPASTLRTPPPLF